MEPSKQVTTLEQSRRLKELGVEFKPLFCYGINQYNESIVTLGLAKDIDYRDTKIAALTCSELGVALPYTHGTIADEADCRIFYAIYSSCFEEHRIAIRGYFKSETEARGALLIHLLETGTVTAAEVNERLNK